MNTKLLIPLTLTLAALLAAAGTGTAQIGVVATSLDISAEAPLAEGAVWDGTQQTGRVNAVLCYDEGGFNPAGGGFILTAAVSAPGWVQADVSPADVVVAPPMGPTTEPGCEAPTVFTVTVRAPDGVEYGASAQISVAITVAEETEETSGAGTAGTYSPPSGGSAGFSLQAMPRPVDADNGDNDAGNGTDTDTTESPVPAVGFGVLLIAGLIALRRRR